MNTQTGQLIGHSNRNFVLIVVTTADVICRYVVRPIFLNEFQLNECACEGMQNNTIYRPQ